jgi:hypothetical protein
LTHVLLCVAAPPVCIVPCIPVCFQLIADSAALANIYTVVCLSFYLCAQNDAAVNGPAANASSRKVLTAPLSALGLAFANLPEPQQAQQEAQLLALVRPLLPHLTDKLLRKKVLQEPRDKLGALAQHREALLAALEDVKGAQGGWCVCLGGGGLGTMRDVLGALAQHREALLTALGDVKGAQSVCVWGGGGGLAQCVMY